MRNLVFVPLCVCFFIASAQESPFQKFGKIKLEDLQTKVYAVDSSANAVVLSDIGEAAVEGNTKGWFSISFTHHKVVHILNKNGYGLADVEIPLYSNGDNEEKLMDLKAVTYNLDGGKIVETKLEKSNIFQEKRSKNVTVRKFTMPNVKEGSIIEFQYRVVSDYIENIDPWQFQGTVPRLWSEYKFSVPQFFTYNFLSYGYEKPFITDKKDKTESFQISSNRGVHATERVSFRAGVTDYRWVMKDVPELKEESFTSSLKNHIARIELQLASQSDPLTFHSYRSTWPALTKQLLQSDYFGSKLNSNNGWLADEMKAVLAGAATDLEKAQKIFYHVRDRFTCTSAYGTFADEQLKTVFKNQKGNVAEINLLLTAMLRYAGLQADPVILSTTDNGYTYDMMPLLNRFNYTICKVKVGDESYCLDASRHFLGFGKLLPECYNGNARVINEDATQLNLSAESLKEAKLTTLFISNAGKNWVGQMKQTPGYYESYRLRGEIKESGTEAFFKTIGKDYGEDVKIENGTIDSLNNYDQPIKIEYKLQMANADEELLYVNPMFAEGFRKNPFTSVTRKYPVEMPYTIDETYVLSMEVPEGYVVDELPKQLMAKYDEEGRSFFEYRVTHSGTIISLRSRIKMDRAFYEPDEYEVLREFFNLVVKKHAEQIVFKKKKA